MSATDDKIFDFIYREALYDATLRGAYEGKKEGIETVAEAKEAVKKYIDKLLDGKIQGQEDHDKIFIKTAKEVCGAINNKMKSDKVECDKKEFAFGNAQKLINMTVKYFYVKYYKTSDAKIRECFKYCHCPMDSIMLKHVWDSYKEDPNRRKKLGTSEVFCGSWGKEGFQKNSDSQKLKSSNSQELESNDFRKCQESWMKGEDTDGFPRYVIYQTAVKELVKSKWKDEGAISPIEYDFYEWNNLEGKMY